MNSYFLFCNNVIMYNTNWDGSAGVGIENEWMKIGAGWSGPPVRKAQDLPVTMKLDDLKVNFFQVNLS